ncbi:MAG: hypothetical protein HYS16_00840 [Deltaproteobacteria bacterium]|nr:MAG: hypothetical protein HYS16_00840 [Deltaproteobacteria bacterium]
MDKLIIEGGINLQGETVCSGSKNAIFLLLCASVLSREILRLENIPNIEDIDAFLEILKQLKIRLYREGTCIWIDGWHLSRIDITESMIKRIRVSILLFCPILVRFGLARIHLPGGCSIGSRPINMHMSVLKKMGVLFFFKKKYLEAKMPVKGIQGSCVDLGIPSMGATCTFLIASYKSSGISTANNFSIEPEILELIIFFLNKGITIFVTRSGLQVAGNRKNVQFPFYRTIIRHKIGPDRMELGTLISSFFSSKGNGIIRNARIESVKNYLDVFRAIGCEIIVRLGKVMIIPTKNTGSILLKSSFFPDFPTDLQAQLSIIQFLIKHHSVIEESIWESRFSYARDLNTQQSHALRYGNVTLINGRHNFRPMVLPVYDLRGAAFASLYSLNTKGINEIVNIKFFDRGYSEFEKKIITLGGKISRESLMLYPFCLSENVFCSSCS